MMEFLVNNWFQLVLLLLVYPAYKGIVKAIENGFSIIPQNIHEKRMEEIKKTNKLIFQDTEYKSTRELQVDNYYRSISGQKVEALFSEWMNILTDTDKVASDQVKLNKMIKELMMYGSTETVKLGSIFMQLNFRKIDEIRENSMLLLYLGARLIASLKKDFTGYEVDPIDLISMKITDISSEKNHKKLEQAKEQIEKIIEYGF